MITALKKAANMHGRVSLFLQNHPIYKTITPQKNGPYGDSGSKLAVK
mgnify:CR=1 FL=1